MRLIFSFCNKFSEYRLWIIDYIINFLKDKSQ